ncbi:hypothetical protein PRK78_002347 [Emydomyces testavorans]|uniref:Aminoglycoside phosphotransferase domain-containing protein n=1 Tax=Emydomyces testavorans TaxID=2070801 RepID=A0AAF0IGD6_9EURO|nr:hypothetical protein PRK78_002347 [Emydomyces testavorans]
MVYLPRLPVTTIAYGILGHAPADILTLFDTNQLPRWQQHRQNNVSSALTLSPAWNATKEFFRFTRGRFLRNEAQELSERCVKFNVDELARIAAEACGGSQCVKVEKFADGMYNKSLLFSMDNGTQVVGKVPNPNAGSPHFTTASEVATMDFYYLGARDSKTRLGLKYIIMERSPGVQLDELWDQLDVGVRWKVVQSLAKYQKLWTDVSFPQFGSLYYKHDLIPVRSLVYTNGEAGEIVDDRFAIGPSTSRQSTEHGRLCVDFDRGPCKLVSDLIPVRKGNSCTDGVVIGNTAMEYEVASGRREMRAIEELSQFPKSPIAIYAPGTYRPSKEKKIAAINGYLKVVKYLLPLDKSIQTSHIWHDDLHAGNIFVNPDNPPEILGFIDWQAAELAPLYHHVLEPYVLDYDGPPLDSVLHRPSLEEVKKLFGSDAISQKKAEKLFAEMSLVALFRRLVQKTNQQLFRGLQFRETLNFNLLLFARNLLVDGEATYLALLEELREKWSEIPGVQEAGNPPFPIHISAEEVSIVKADCEGAAAAIDLMKEVQERAGKKYFRMQGVVDHAQFDEAKRALRNAKVEMIKEHAKNDEEVKAWNAAWPFDD